MADRYLSQDELVAMGFAELGRGVRLDRSAIVVSADRIRIGDQCRIDAFSLITGGAGVSFGRNVHVAAGAYLFGGGGIEVGDFAGISARAILYSANDDYSGEFMTGPTLAARYTNVIEAPIRIGRHVVVGAGSIVLPGVTIGDGAAVGAMTLIKADVAPFALVAGRPPRVLRQRAKRMLALEAEFLGAEVDGKA